jgi:hypothetical protein
MPEQVTERILHLAGSDLFRQEPFSRRVQLQRRLSVPDGAEELGKLLGEDEDGYQMLACMLLAGEATREKYREKGISDMVFYDTFRCFPRFVREHRASFGRFGFDRAWWTYRQVGMKLFRIGTLEYEMAALDGQPAVSVHIPSGCPLDAVSRKESYQAAGEFFRTYYPDFAQVPYICDSWLLAPALKEVLPEDSHILAFQREYEIRSVDPDDQGFLLWVFQTEKLPVAELPEDTSLQRNLKQRLLSGGRIGRAVGVLKRSLYETAALAERIP